MARAARAEIRARPLKNSEKSLPSTIFFKAAASLLELYGIPPPYDSLCNATLWIWVDWGLVVKQFWFCNGYVIQSSLLLCAVFGWAWWKQRVLRANCLGDWTHGLWTQTPPQLLATDGTTSLWFYFQTSLLIISAMRWPDYHHTICWNESKRPWWVVFKGPFAQNPLSHDLQHFGRLKGQRKMTVRWRGERQAILGSCWEPGISTGPFLDCWETRKHKRIDFQTWFFPLALWSLKLSDLPTSKILYPSSQMG